MGTIAFPNAFKNQHFDPPRARFLRSIKARKLAGDFPRTTSLNAHQNARRIGRETGYIRHPENNNADTPADHYSDFPAPHPYSGHRAEIRYRADVSVRRRLDRGAEKVRGRRDASARHRSSGMDTIYSQRKKAVLRGNQHRQHP